jgi:hypothetical protein
MLRGVRVDFLPAMDAILLIGLRIFVYDCALNILYFPLFMYFVMWGFTQREDFIVP